MSNIPAINTSTCIQARLRRALKASPKLARTLRSGRAILHFGPWRHVARAVIRIARPPKEQATTHNPCRFQFDTVQLVRTLRADGIALAGILPPNVLMRVREITDRLPPGEYGDFHEIPDVRALVGCGTTLAVPRMYFQAEPELLECNLVVAHAEKPSDPVQEDSQRHFHFDYAGWHSLNLFIYLTDVSKEAGAHQVVIGTHRSRTFRDAIRIVIPDNDINTRFHDRVQTITGAAGTMFFEDTSAFHRRKMHTTRRVMLNILYASHRSWLSKGRLTLKYADYLRLCSTPSDPCRADVRICLM